MHKPNVRGRRLPVALFATVVALAALTCQNTTSFHLLEAGEATLTPAAPAGVVAFADLDQIDLAGRNMMKRQALTPADLHQLRPHAATLSISDPATGQDLTFLRRVEVVVTAPNLPEKVVASGQDFATGTNTVGLEVHDVDLLAHARSRKMTTQIRAIGADVAPVVMNVRLALILAVAVDQPKGACS